MIHYEKISNICGALSSLKTVCLHNYYVPHLFPTIATSILALYVTINTTNPVSGVALPVYRYIPTYTDVYHCYQILLTIYTQSKVFVGPASPDRNEKRSFLPNHKEAWPLLFTSPRPQPSPSKTNTIRTRRVLVKKQLPLACLWEPTISMLMGTSH